MTSVMYDKSDRRSSLESAPFGMSKRQQEQFQESCKKADEVLKWIEESEEVLTLKEASIKAGLHKDWFTVNTKHRARYERIIEAIRLKKSEELRARYGGVEGRILNPEPPKYEPNSTGLSLFGTAPAVKARAMENWEKFIDLLNQMIKEGINDPKEWTREAIARKMGLSSNYFSKHHAERRAILDQAKKIVGVE